MAGAGQFVENYYKEVLKAGDAAAKNGAGAFQTLVTSCFSDPRISQPHEDYGVLNKTFELGKDVVAKYNSGNAGPLGAHLADCVRNLKATGTGASWGVLSADMVAGARLIGRIQELFDKHEDIKQAANLTEKELEFMRGYVQLGKAYDHYLTAIIKTNDAAARGEKLSTEAKTEILADVILRNLISKNLAADKARHDADPAFRRELDEALQKDNASMDLYQPWKEENPDIVDTREGKLYRLSLSVGAHRTVVSAKDLDHGIIYTLAKNGMLEKMRSELMQNPAIREAAAKEPFEFSGKDLEDSKNLDALAAQAEATNNLWKTQVWYENLKTTLMGSQPENWLNPNTPGDNNRLMVGVTVNNPQTGAPEGKLIGLDAILQGGVKALENPSQETLNILYAQAAKGNLYFYDVGKDMPMRVGAENARFTAEQLKVPPQPTAWQRFANLITFGLAYADICNPKPDKDPAVFEAIVTARASRSAAAQNEAQQRKQQIEQAGMDPKQVEEPEQNKEMEKEEEPSQMMGRQLAVYNQENVNAAFGRFAVQEEKYLPAADQNTMGLTNEEIGVLGAIASGSTEISFKAKKGNGTEIFQNKPDEYYSTIITNGIAMGTSIPSRTARSVLTAARYQVKKALETGDMDKLGKMIVQGLTQNNKWLSKQTDLSDYYTVYAELGGKLLNIVEKNEALKEAFDKHLGKNTNQINIAKAAKNISDLRVKILPVKERVVKAFDNYEKARAKGAINTPRPAISGEELSSLGQLCVIQNSMKLKCFDLAKTKYSNSKAVAAGNAKMKDNKILENFRTKAGHIEVILDDVVEMATMFTDAAMPKKAPEKNQNQMQNTLNKENEMQNEPSKPGPTA